MYNQTKLAKKNLLSLVAICEGPVRLRVTCNIRELRGLGSSHHFVDELLTEAHFVLDSVSMRTWKLKQALRGVSLFRERLPKSRACAYISQMAIETKSKILFCKVSIVQEKPTTNN